MANPNIVNVSAIYGGRFTGSPSFGTTTTMVSNSSSSGMIYKINTVTVANRSATDSGVSVWIYNGADYYIAYELAVPPNASLVILDKNSSLYLIEGDSLRATLTTNGNAVDIIVSYDTIND